jgi:hypothetical protein
VGLPPDSGVRGDFTPFGCLRNPFAVAQSWEHAEGGGLRSTLERPGFGWVYPWARAPRAGGALELGCAFDARRWDTRAEFQELGLRSVHHSCLVFSYDWEVGGLAFSAKLVLAERDVLLCVVDVATNTVPSGLEQLELHLRLHGWLRDGAVEARLVDGAGLVAPANTPGAVPPPHWLVVDAPVTAQAVGPETGTVTLTLRLNRGPARIRAALARGPLGRARALAALPRADDILALQLQSDQEFWSHAPRLEGDWPSHWRNGWVYDLETTRMLLFPPGGIFQDVWPAWMVDWPRAVLAEGTLDSMRLSYARPDLAQRAALSLFRDTPGPNVPCVFQGGEPNMVAEDGSVCGTSPAWCLPFYNLWLMYLRTLDRAWLADLFLRLESYLRWWLAERTDEQGWVVYRCTWESGEDASPRLDPDREGDHVITQYTRPVELQATTSQSASVLAYFARQLGRDDAVAAWERVAQDYRLRTRRLWDEREGRFRDWDKRRERFVQPSGVSDYWGSDPARFSPLSLTPLLFDVATPQQRARLRAEIEHYNAAPTVEWPSWSWVVLEAATWAGYHDFAGPMAAGIVERVYWTNDRRTYEGPPYPVPGVAPEYWPLDPSSFQGSAGYGWGANTATMLLRQVIGFQESPTTDGCHFKLAPGPLPGTAPGRQYRVSNLTYRGRRFDLVYQPTAGGIEAALELSEPAHCQVEGLYVSQSRARAHRFRLAQGTVSQVTLTP